MDDDKDKLQCDSREDCSENCCAGKSCWIWLALIVAVLAVFALRHRGTNADKPAPDARKQPGEPAETVATTSGARDASSTESSSIPVSLPRLVDLGAGKCIPCKMMEPILEDLRAEYTDKLDVVFIDVWKNPKDAERYGIKVIPTQIFYDPDGRELFRHEGFFSKEDILNKWAELGYAFTAEKEDINE